MRLASYITAPILIALASACAPSSADPGTLVVDGAAAKEVTSDLLKVTVRWTHQSGRDAQLIVLLGEKEAFASIPGRAFIGGGAGTMQAHESRGLVRIEDDLSLRCETQTVSSLDDVSVAPERFEVLLTGDLQCEGDPVPYSMRLRTSYEDAIAIAVALDEPDGPLESWPDLNRVALRFASSEDERFFGFGEQFTYVDLKGARVPIVTSEQGIGRGAFPITAGADLTAGAGGDWSTTYAPVPSFVTNKGRGFRLNANEYSEFDLTRSDEVTVHLFSSHLNAVLSAGATAADVLARQHVPMGPLPDWVHEGAIIGVQGGTARVQLLHQKLMAAGVAVSAYWMQDWVGQRTTSFGKQLWWNWTLDEERYPGWDNLVAELRRDGARVLGYVNPFLVDVADKPGASRNLFTEAKGRDFLVQTEDGTPYLIPNTDFSAGLLDLTNPYARRWFQDVLRDEVIARGFSGWMADFGEALPFDAKLQDGDAAEWHNYYPVAWAALNNTVADRETLFFTRSGFTNSQRFSTLFWLGDQLVSWDEHDGLKSAITGLMSGGLSGFTLNHSDIGGYTTIDNPLQNYHRDAELLARWTEFGAFTVVMRTHEGNRPDSNVQIDSTEGTLAHFARMVRVWRAWAPYRRQLVQEAASSALPVARHLLLHYPEDPNVLGLRYETFLVGSDLLVAPVSDPGVTKARAYLPRGEWIHIWTGREHISDGSWITVDAPIGSPAVFTRKGSPGGDGFLAALRADKLIDW